MTGTHFRGKVWKFGDNLDVDRDIVPEHAGVEDARARVMGYVNPEFAKKVQQGDLLVAGRNFGCGHGHYQAPYAIQQAGVSAVVAESVGRQFFRNAIALGFPVLTCKGISKKVQEGDELEVDLESGKIRNLRTKEEMQANPLPPLLLEILKAGGQMPVLRTKLGIRPR